MKYFEYFAFTSLSLLIASASAHELGTIGTVYPIGEESALDMIMKKLHQKERSGELKKLQQAAIDRSMANIKMMKAVDGITTATVRVQRLIDPTVTYTQAVKTDEGRIVIPSGAKINPLEVMTLSKSLVFFDGRDPDQCKAVSRLVLKLKNKIKPVLVAGSWFDLTKSWKTQVYFDQKGILAKRFGIQAVPTVISQQGSSLLLEEIPAKELQ
jgi:conjugal transfer pilus assembly protein TraW